MHHSYIKHTYTRLVLKWVLKIPGKMFSEILFLQLLLSLTLTNISRSSSLPLSPTCIGSWQYYCFWVIYDTFASQFSARGILFMMMEQRIIKACLPHCTALGITETVVRRATYIMETITNMYSYLNIHNAILIIVTIRSLLSCRENLLHVFPYCFARDATE